MQLFSSWAGSDFLFAYSGLLAAACAAAWWIPARWRRAGRPGDEPDFESMALLTGGRSRLAQAVMADLYVRGGIVEASDGRLVIGRCDLSPGAAGTALLTLAEPLTVRTARRAIIPYAERLEARLRRSRLLLWPDDHWRLRWLSVAPFAALLMLGLYRQRAGFALGEPTGLLALLLGLTALLAIIRFFNIDPRTKAGMAAVQALRAREPDPGRAAEAAMAVALSGTAVLIGTAWEPLHTLRLAGGSAAGSSDGSSGEWGDGDVGGDGGGDGGGCGD
jgi:uncharacterized protein (TIGR04222 family)